MADEFVFTRAARLAVPLLVSLSGTSGSGKTFSGLLLAAGIAGDSGQVGMIDAENGRGSMYADDEDIIAAMPKGYIRTEISAPYTPARYMNAIRAAEKAGVTVLIVDSTSHEWEGSGGCTEIAENNKTRNGKENWAMAKKEHKKFMYFCLSSRMHIIFCLRARDKVKILPDGKVVPLGILPVCEKNFVFEMLISLIFDEATHCFAGLKVPKMLRSTLEEGNLITRTHGELLRKWNEGGRGLDPMESVQKRARWAAEQGMEDYTIFFNSLTAKERKDLAATTHGENKSIASHVDERNELLAKQQEADQSAEV